MNTFIAKTLLKIAVWALDLVWNKADLNKDGNISKEELFELAKYADKKSKDLFKIIKK